jgi:hypothetical protein
MATLIRNGELPNDLSGGNAVRGDAEDLEGPHRNKNGRTVVVKFCMTVRNFHSPLLGHYKKKCVGFRGNPRL